MTVFTNNLRSADPVIHAVSRRPGKIVAQPRESSVNVQVLFQGSNTPVYVHISKLRLVVDGKPEDVPPYDGEIPVKQEDELRPMAGTKYDGTDPRHVIQAQRDRLKSKMDEMNKEFAGYREQVERLDAALLALG